MKRRDFVRSSLVGALALPAFLRRAAADEGARAARRKVLVTIFQRGACDGLSMVPPLGDERYRALRPNISIAPRGEDAALDLDGYFALHPALSGLKASWDAGALAVLHEVGSPDGTRSHFDAQDFMESGTPGEKNTDDGYLNRALVASSIASHRGALRAVALQPTLPRSLAGPAPAVALASLDEFGLRPGLASAGVQSGFESMYRGAVDATFRGVGDEAFSAITALKAKVAAAAKPDHGAAYPQGPLGQRLSQLAQLIKGDVGLEIAATDCGGWDTHAGQGAGTGQLAQRLKELGDSLGAFAQDLGDRMADVCVVTMTEFGRTVKENGTRGTDHGHGSAMLVLGGAVRGKRVLARWKGLKDENLFEGRDLPVTTDFRDALAEILSRHLGVGDVGRVFPGYALDPARRPGLLG